MNIRAFLAGLLLAVTAASSAQQSNVGGATKKPSFTSVGIGVAAPSGTGRIYVSDANPLFAMIESDQGVGDKSSRWQLNSQELRYQICDDAFSSCALTPLTIKRTGVVQFSNRIEASSTYSNGWTPPTGTAEGIETGCAAAGACQLLSYRRSDSTYRPLTLAGSSVVIQLNGGTTENVAGETSGSYTAAVVGCTTNPAPTVNYAKSGNVVTVKIRNFTCTSNAFGLSITGAPAAIQPASTTGDCVLFTLDNTAARATGYGTIAGGTWTFSPSNAISTWTNSGTKGIGSLGGVAAQCTYLLN